MNEKQKKINEIHEIIDAAKRDESYKQGQLESTMVQLKEKYGTSSLEDVQKAIKSKEKKKDAIMKEVDKDYKELMNFAWE
jgi:hypothetical protein